ncbi:hypothetical protein [Actinopolymorpha sp. B9G3]|uniref:hypothetical protein n=1 Tax=Actinopolymorpha sp. B9G3 TaxID=3158970 RepID=UPI0032D97585
MDDSIPQVTYGPDFGPAVEWENFVLLEALQSSQGAIGPTVRGIAVEAGTRRVVIHACLAHRDETDVRELQDMASDLLYSLEFLCEPVPSVELSLYIGETVASWPGHMHRRLYLAAGRLD